MFVSLQSQLQDQLASRNQECQQYRNKLQELTDKYESCPKPEMINMLVALIEPLSL